jgi:probable HAF family extracellular repeat protein
LLPNGNVTGWFCEDKMNKNKTAAAIGLLTLATLAIPVHLAAQDQKKYLNHYELIDVGTLGGPTSILCVSCFDGQFFASRIVNQQGTAVGFADTSNSDPLPAFCFFDCSVNHAFQWRNGAVTDLGALTNNTSSAANWISPNGLIAGVSENGETDPLFPGLPELHAVLWQQGRINDLGTLERGYQSYASAVNSLGQVVGAALNTTLDANSMQPGIPFWLWGGVVAYQYQTRAFLWDKQNGMRDLGTLPGGSDAQAVFINELGQVVGYYYTSSASSAFCASKYSFALTTGSFIWDKENGMQDLGNLGGTCTLAFGLNNQGQVAGVSSLTNDKHFHAFLWQRGQIEDLGTLGGHTSAPGFISDAGDVVGVADLPGPLPQKHHAILWRNGRKIDLGVLTEEGDSCSRAYGINSSGQVVGNSESEELCDFSGEHAFLWQDGGPMIDLNSLIPPGSSLELSHALAITDRGEIVGLGVPPGCPPSEDDVCGHAFVLIPCDTGHPGIEGCDYSLVDPATAVEFHSGQTTNASAAAASHITLTPSEMTPRFRSSLAGRNRRYGTPQSSPQ